MTKQFTERLRERVAAMWDAQMRHPFVRGIADGTLELAKFQFWLCQDYVFLIEYSRLFALAAARSPNLQTMTRFAALLHETIGTEMNLHRGYAAEFGITVEQLEHTLAAPATRAYTDFLLRAASLGDFAELTAALLPCMWAFSEIGQHLAAQPPVNHNRYATWIEMYSSGEFAELAEWCRELLDERAAGLPERDLQRLEDVFLTSTRYEWLFWEMAWKKEQWPA